jgi:hypothetical protein
VTIRRIALALLAAAALSGCGSAVRVAYNNGDIALRFIAHDYFDLHGEQSDLLKAQLARLHAWHRREELPRYAALFNGAADRLDKGLAREDVAWAIASVRERYRALAEQAADEAAPLMATLRPDNFGALERKLAENNEKFAREFLTGDATKQAQARAKRLTGWFEDWLGSLTREQEALVAQFVQLQPELNRIRSEDRKRRQHEFVALLRAHQKSPDLGARLRDFLVNWERERGPEHRRMAREWEERLVTLIVDMDRTLTPKQRTHVVQRFARFADDARILAREGRPAGTTAAVSIGEASVAQ